MAATCSGPTSLSGVRALPTNVCRRQDACPDQACAIPVADGGKSGQLRPSRIPGRVTIRLLERKPASNVKGNGRFAKGHECN